MPEPITFNAQLWRVHVDHEGESRVTFAIPLSDLDKVLKIGEHSQQLLKVKVDIVPGTS